MFSRLEMSRRSVVALVVMLVVVMWLHLGTPSRAYSNAAPQILGKTYGEWSAVWWQWALTEPEGTNPMLDTNGNYAGLNQKGPVWFLAGTFPPLKSPVTRKVNIPKEKYIFFPITNSFQAAEGIEEQEREYLFGIINPLGSNLICTLDGVPVPVVFNPNIPIVRSQSPVFTLHIYANNIFNAPPGNYSPAVSDGYWVMLQPLSRGLHTLHFADGVSQDVTYQLTVE